MEVRHECTTLRTKLYEFVTQKVRLHTAYAIALNSLHLVKGLAQVEETLTCCLSEVADVHTGEHNLLAAFSCSLFCLSHERSNGGVTGVATCIWNGAIGAVVVAAVLYLKEIACAVATRARRCERLNHFCLYRVELMQRFSLAILIAFSNWLLWCPCVTQELYEIRLLVRSQNEVYTIYLAHWLRFQLCIASCNNHEGTRIVTYKTMDGLTTFMVSHFGYRASIHQTDVSNLAFFSNMNTQIGKHLAESRGFREVQLAS